MWKLHYFSTLSHNLYIETIYINGNDFAGSILNLDFSISVLTVLIDFDFKWSSQNFHWHWSPTARFSQGEAKSESALKRPKYLAYKNLNSQFFYFLKLLKDHSTHNIT